FLLGVTPVDAAEAWQKFKESDYAEPPSFRYRPLTTDPELLLRQLYEVPLEHVEDPTLDRIFREKLREVARQLTMFAERNTHRFLYGSLQLYGGIEPQLLELAEALLEAIPDAGNGDKNVVDAEDFAQLATHEFARYREQSPEFDAELDIRDDISGLMVSRGTLLIDRSLSLAPSRAHALLHHEVGTHVVTWMNGRSQPLHIFRTGLAGYEQMQEGLAVLAEYLVGGLTPGRLSLLAARVVAVERMVRGASFIEIFDELTGVYGLGSRTAFTATMRVTRGGGLTKDAVYLRGLQEVIGYLRDGGDLELLYIGKIALAHVPVAQELLYRGVLHASPLRPTCLDAPEAAKRLSQLREGLPIVQMYERNA
ncbi:MAG: flavohemoglobin expression-modulating QEGLA motif protein, partial [Gemmatimonadota bacterium]